MLLGALLTAGMIAATWVESVDGPLLVPLAAAYFLFNIGYVAAGVRGWLQTKAAKLGLTAVGFNFLATLLSDVLAAWTVLSVCAVATALVAAWMLLGDAKRAALSRA